MRIQSTLKTVAGVLGILLLVVAFELLRELTGIPVTLLDFLITPLCLIFIYMTFREGVLKRDRRTPHPIEPCKTWMGYSGTLLVFILMIAFGSWGVWFGCMNPFLYMSGVKGAGHGYTLAVIGVLLIQLGGIGVWQLRLKRPRAEGEVG